MAEDILHGASQGSHETMDLGRPCIDISWDRGGGGYPKVRHIAPIYCDILKEILVRMAGEGVLYSTFFMARRKADKTDMRQWNWAAIYCVDISWDGGGEHSNIRHWVQIYCDILKVI